MIERGEFARRSYGATAIHRVLTARVVLAGLAAWLWTTLAPAVTLAQQTTGDDGSALLAGGATVFCILLALVVNILILIWVYRDANKRGANGTLWAVLTLFFGIFALIVYFIIRPKDSGTGYRI